MPKHWNLELCHCWFSVQEGSMILCYCSYLLQTLSGIWYWSCAWWVAALNFPTDQCWPVLLLHESIAFPRSHYHVGNLASFFKNGPESCMLKLQNTPPHPKEKQQMVTDHLKIGMLQQQEVRSKAEILLSGKWSDTMGWKRAGKGKANMKQEDRNHISS